MSQIPAAHVFKARNTGKCILQTRRARMILPLENEISPRPASRPEFLVAPLGFPIYA